MKFVFISIFLCVLSCIIWAENTGLVAEDVTDNTLDKYFDATHSPISESLFTSPVIQKLPANHVNFEDIILNGLIFVDKTAFIKKLLELPGSCGQPFVIICRPSRFGKTIFVHMLEQFFRGNKTFFHNTAIAELMPGEWTTYPVIHISFNFAPFIKTLEDVAEFKLLLKDTLHHIGESYGFGRESSFTIDILIENLAMKKGKPVVILIDEYDKVFQKASTADEKVFNKLKMAVARFYNQIKNQEDNIKLLFITGISRMSLDFFERGVSLAYTTDLTFSKDFSSAMGFTLHEITTNFGPSLQSLAIENGTEYSSIIESITTWYDGYRFSPEDRTKVFNPISVITALSEQKIDYYWAGMSNIHWPIQRMKKSNTDFQEFLYYDLSLSVIASMYSDERESTIPLAALLYIYGYLTILRYNKKTDTVFLTYPNKEIASAILNELSQSQSDLTYNLAIQKSFQQGDINNMVKFVNNAAFYRQYRLPNLKMDEVNATKYIADALKNANLSVEQTGMMVDGSNHQSKGDLNIIITCPGFISMAISLKYKSSAVKAISQLINYAISNETEFRRCVGKFSKNDDPVHTQLIGMNVDEKKRELLAIEDWILVPYRGGKVFMNESQANNIDALVNLKKILPQKTEKK